MFPSRLRCTSSAPDSQSDRPSAQQNLRRAATQQERRQQSAWRSSRRLWLSQLAALLPAIPDLPAALHEALAATLARPAVPAPGGASVSLSDAANGSAAAAAVTESVAAVEGARAGAALLLAALADVLLTLRSLAGWQLSASDAGRLRLDTIPAVSMGRCFMPCLQHC